MLFFQTETLHLPITQATEYYFIASIWDGIASMLVALTVDRWATGRARRMMIIIGALPLGLSFVWAYSPSPYVGLSASAWVLVSQMAFRTAYALVNVPYLALSTRISAHSRDRSLVAGLRMIFGTLAAVVVAFGTVPLGLALSRGDGVEAYRAAAMVFAFIATLLLMVVGWTYRDGAIPKSAPAGSIRDALFLAWRNRAFVTLAAAMTAMIVAATVLDRSILYYFKYTLSDQGAGQATLAWMAAVSGVVLPLWIAASRSIGVRAIWFVAVGLAVAWLGLFIVTDLYRSASAQVLLVLIQAMIVGLNFAVWATLPDTIEYGQVRTGVRIEAVLYGYVALIQRVAIGIGALLLGATLTRAGVDVGPHQPPATPMGFRLAMALTPVAFLLLSAGLMALNPLKRGAHASLLDAMES